MFEPTRGGTRGGQAEFKWSDVSADKDREHYLGHSINAPTGRWQKNKDVHWYNRDLNNAEEQRQAEIRRIKEAEEEAMAQMLGFAPTKKTIDANANGDKKEVDAGTSGEVSPPGDDTDRDKLERRKRKMEKKAKKVEKKARKEAKRMGSRRSNSPSDHGRDDRYRERREIGLPRRADSRERSRRRRSASPSRIRHRSVEPSPRRDTRDVDYDFREQEHERERDRRRWEANASRDLPRSQRAR